MPIRNSKTKLSLAGESFPEIVKSPPSQSFRSVAQPTGRRPTTRSQTSVTKVTLLSPLANSRTRGRPRGDYGSEAQCDRTPSPDPSSYVLDNHFPIGSPIQHVYRDTLAYSADGSQSAHSSAPSSPAPADVQVLLAAEEPGSSSDSSAISTPSGCGDLSDYEVEGSNEQINQEEPDESPPDVEQSNDFEKRPELASHPPSEPEQAKEDEAGVAVTSELDHCSPHPQFPPVESTQAKAFSPPSCQPPSPPCQTPEPGGGTGGLTTSPCPQTSTVHEHDKSVITVPKWVPKLGCRRCYDPRCECECHEVLDPHFFGEEPEDEVDFGGVCEGTLYAGYDLGGSG